MHSYRTHGDLKYLSQTSRAPQARASSYASISSLEQASRPASR